MNQTTFWIIIAFIVLVVLYFYNCTEDFESFYIPQNIVGTGDFGIDAPGTIADQGSFTNDMADYMEGQGPI